MANGAAAEAKVTSKKVEDFINPFLPKLRIPNVGKRMVVIHTIFLDVFQ
jgi:hypothetical protein